jgi:hypothetical protein
MTEVLLERTSIVAVVRKLVPAGVPKHVRVDAEWHLGGHALICCDAKHNSYPRCDSVFAQTSIMEYGPAMSEKL